MILPEMKTSRLDKNELAKLRNMEFETREGFVDAESILSAEVGAIGAPARDDFDAKAMAWYYGEVLKTRRKEIGLTQQQLAEEIGCKRTYLSRIEKGDTDIQLSSFIRIAHALGLKLALL